MRHAVVIPVQRDCRNNSCASGIILLSLRVTLPGDRVITLQRQDSGWAYRDIEDQHLSSLTTAA